MGLEQYIALPSTIECPAAYIKITKILSMDFVKRECLIEVNFYKDYESRLSEAGTIMEPRTYLITNNSKRHLKQKVQEVEISLPNASDDLQIFFNDNPQPDVVITEGVDFLVRETAESTLQNIVDSLNQNITFAENWTASHKVEFDRVQNAEKCFLIFTSKHFVENSQLSTVQDVVGISGTMFISRSPYLNDSEQVVHDFDNYFTEVADLIRTQSYLNLKSTDDHKTALDR